MKRTLKEIVMGRQNPYKEIEKAIGYRFDDVSLLESALTHRSYRFENPSIESDNQRLEFLGDAVLGLVAAAFLFDQHSDKDEGWLTSLRSQITSGKALADLARSIHIGNYIKFGKGEELSGGRKRASNLTDAVEAILGAVYMDGGTKAVEKVFQKLFVPLLAKQHGDVWADNPKGKLQEYAQRIYGCSPRYHLIRKEGLPHEMSFTVEAHLTEGHTGSGVGANKRDAEREAAADLLKKLLSVHAGPG